MLHPKEDLMKISQEFARQLADTHNALAQVESIPAVAEQQENAT